MSEKIKKIALLGTLSLLNSIMPICAMNEEFEQTESKTEITGTISSLSEKSALDVVKNKFSGELNARNIEIKSENNDSDLPTYVLDSLDDTNSSASNSINILDFKSSDENISKLFNIILEKYFDFSIELKEEPYTIFDDDWSLFRKIRNIMLSELAKSGVNIKVLQDDDTKKCVFFMTQPEKLDLVYGAQGFFNAIFHYDPEAMPEFKEGLDKKYDLTLKTHPDIPVMVVSSLNDDYLSRLMSNKYIKQFIKTNAIELNLSEFI